jgi:polyhydroxybutyrate depolymerase
METAAAMMADTAMEAIAVDGQIRNYHLHVPPTYQAGSALPLVLNFHGYNSNAIQEERVSRMSIKADEVGFIVAYPEGLGEPQSWKFGSLSEGKADVAFARALIDHLAGHYTIDANRIYATGISNGAEMSYRLACDLADKLAAVGLVSGGYPPFRDCQPAHPVPVVVFHGTADNVLAYDGQPPLLLPVRDWAAGWAERNGCNSTPVVSLQQGDVTGETWGECRDQAEVVLYTIAGKGHSWPGSNMPAQITTQDIDATDVIWEFFVTHPYPAR